MTQSTHCNFSCVLQIDDILSSPNDKNFSCYATIQNSPHTVVQGIEYRDTIPVTVTYYNVFNETFLENAMIFCIGSLLITQEGSADPKLAVRSHCLIRFD
jgi:hypothetical protein